MSTPTTVGSGDDSADWLALYRTPGLRGRALNTLIQHFPDAKAILAADPQQLLGLGLERTTVDALKRPDWRGVEADMAWLQQPGNHLLRITDSAYPPLLAQIAAPPPLLFVHGDPDYLRQPMLAMVGSRNPSHEGIALAKDFAGYLGDCGLTICSGLATGIDAAAHRGALGTAAGTVAVTGTGLDRVYPAQHHELAHQIGANGALVSEFPPGTAPLAANFPRRNRIISGLSVGTLVVEAALRSGSLITARQALEQGREVFAIPGSIHNPLARGCHALIREGAKLVENGAHVLEELAPLLGVSAEPIDAGQTEAAVARETADDGYGELLETMGFAPVTVDQLVARSGLTPEVVSSMLLLLELDGKVHSGAGGRYTRAR